MLFSRHNWHLLYSRLQRADFREPFELTHNHFFTFLSHLIFHFNQLFVVRRSAFAVLSYQMLVFSYHLSGAGILKLFESIHHVLLGLQVLNALQLNFFRALDLDFLINLYLLLSFQPVDYFCLHF